MQSSNETEISDESLMLAVLSGEHAAFSSLVKRHSEKFYRVSFRILNNQHGAEDIVQQAFLKLWEKPQIWNADKGAKFTTWFYRVIINMSIDAKRKSDRYGKADIDGITSEEDIENNIIKKEMADLIENGISNLPERQMLALNLCFYENMSNKQAAEIIEVSIKALESLLMRAKTNLKEELSNLIKVNQEIDKNVSAG